VTEDDKTENSIIPKGSTDIVKISNYLTITDKILSESLSREIIGWWNSLDDIWKKIINASIGKIPEIWENISTGIFINEYGTTETPNEGDIKIISNISSVNYNGSREWTKGMFTQDSDYSKINDIKPLKKLNQLKSLTLDNWSGKLDLSPLIAKKIECLDLHGDIENFEVLSTLKCLKNLKIKTINADFDAKSIENSLIEELEIKGRIKNVDSISSLKKLMKLTINFSQLSDISFLMNLKSLTNLDLSCNSIKNAEVISNIVSLNHLNIGQNEIITIDWVKNFKNLETLNIGFNDLESIEPIGVLKSIKSLNIRQTKTSDLNAISNLNNLEILLAEGNYISDLSPLYNLKKLIKLNIRPTFSNDNQLTQSDLEKFQKSVPFCKVRN
jgi:Leucine-rich repeat (LRR) protein